MAACTAASTPEPSSARGTPMRRPASGVLERGRAERRDVGHRRVRRGRVGGVVAGHRGEHVGGVLDGARERPDLVERRAEGEQAVARDAAVGRLEADDAAQRGRLADRAAGVGAERDRRQAGRHRDRRAAARAAGDAVERPRVAGDAERRVLGRRAHRELVAVGLAEDDRAGRLEALDGRRRVGRHEALEDPRGGRRRHVARAEVVLHRHRHAEQRPIGRRRVLGVERRGPGQHPRRIDVQEGAEPAAGGVAAIEPGDARPAAPAPLRSPTSPCSRIAWRVWRAVHWWIAPLTRSPSARGRGRSRGPASGALRSAASRRQRGPRLVGAQRRAIELDVRRRLDAGRVDGADLLDVGEDGRQLAAQPGPLLGGQGQPGELGDAQDVTV